ncbi:MAG: hypothetical protein EOS12_20570 [Mesorhizobium sp.]|nr:MAG: hypothetical protein EOS12_20570 [Mesorhizobium sp.]
MFAPSRPPLACRPSPPQGGRSAALSPLLVLPLLRIAKAAECAISPLEGEMSGRTEGGGLGLRQIFPSINTRRRVG